MKKYSFLLLCLSLSFIVLYGCQHKTEVQPTTNSTNGTGNNGNGNGNGNGNNPADTALCFERDILPIFITNCTQSGCHDAVTRAEGYQFTDYNSITSKGFVKGNAAATELYQKIIEDRADKIMPPPPEAPLTAAQIALIRRWINEGAENSTNCVSKCDTNIYTYSGAVATTLSARCVGCHSGASASKGIVLDNYANVKTYAQSGLLLGSIKHQTGYSPMPQGGKLSDCEIRQIERWIENGLLNN
ncbi:MAG: c-type cytochrome domain-containing protein [Flavipsychrobacter sp.]